jgi:hypothetical protein
MARNRNSFFKLQREKEKKRKAEEKRERRRRKKEEAGTVAEPEIVDPSAAEN